MELLLIGFTGVLLLLYSFAILNSQAFKIDISEILVGKTGIQSALAQQDNSTTDDEPADDEPADDEPADDEPADDDNKASKS